MCSFGASLYESCHQHVGGEWNTDDAFSAVLQCLYMSQPQRALLRRWKSCVVMIKEYVIVRLPDTATYYQVGFGRQYILVLTYLSRQSILRLLIRY